MSYKAAIFDLDGTLADTLESIAYSGNQTLERLGLKPLPVENYRYYAGDGAKELCRRILADAKGPKERLEELFSVYTEVFEKTCMYRVRPYDGIVELLAELKNRGIRTAVLSNKPHARAKAVIGELFGEDTFAWVQGQMEGIPRKPSPDGALAIAARFKAEPGECIYLGDTDTDMKTGTAAGMFTVGVLWGFREEKELLANGAMMLAKEPRDVLKLL